MTVEVETSADNEELSITEASLEFGVSEAVIRQAVRTYRLPSIPHCWGLRVRREDVAELASSVSPRPPRQSAPRLPRSPRALSTRRTPRSHKSQREVRILGLVEELGEASISRIHPQKASSGSQEHPSEAGDGPAAVYLSLAGCLSISLSYQFP